jgi:hypothetical protein
MKKAQPPLFLKWTDEERIVWLTKLEQGRKVIP